MSDSGLWNTIVSVVREHMALAEPVVFALGFAEGIPGLSILVPSTPLFLGIGTAHGAVGGQFWHLWLAGAAGAVVSDCLVYLLGRHFKDRINHIKAFERHPDWRDRGEALFRKWGVLAIVGGKFTGFMRPFIPAVAGVSEMPFVVFLPASIVSSLAWAGAFLAPGYGLRWFID